MKSLSPKHLDNDQNLIKHINVKVFKKSPCRLSNNHNQKRCFYFHNLNDRVRNLKCKISRSISPKLCEIISKKSGGKCFLKENCPKSHNQVEYLYHKANYKKKFCSNYPNNLDKCEYGEFCSFAHSELEVRTELIHNYQYDYDFYIFNYKTVWCPFNLSKHEKSLCVYAHNWQDYRRKPNKVKYEGNHCKNWKNNKFINNYSDGCFNGLNCNKCHGWKELEFHPDNFKMNPCLLGDNCFKKNSGCSNYHSLREKRLNFF